MIKTAHDPSSSTARESRPFEFLSVINFKSYLKKKKIESRIRKGVNSSMHSICFCFTNYTPTKQLLYKVLSSLFRDLKGERKRERKTAPSSFLPGNLFFMIYDVFSFIFL